MSKFLLNLLLKISKALVNSKIQFLFEKNFSSAFGPIGPAASQPTRPLSPASPTGPPFSPAGRACVLGPSRPARHWRICQKPSLLRVCAARRRRLLPLSPSNGPHMLASSSPPRRSTPVRISPRRRSPRAAAPRLGCPRALQPSLITLPP
jgi:hypothetical protein